MALIAPPLFYPTSKPWETDDSGTASFPSTISTMSYRYPPPPSGGHDVDMSQPDYHRSFGMPAPSLTGMENHQVPMLTPKGHEDPNPTLRRSYSMPNAGPMQTHEPEQAQMASGEKKRNKLGYHRTSIACSHCRRRKIRCIPSSDNQSTCQNCIRLKKQCSFLPVDQQSPADARLKGSSRASTGPKVGSSGSSSPAMSSGNPAEVPSQPSVPQMPMTSTGIVPSNVHQPHGENFHESKAPWSGQPLSRPFDYTGQPADNWVDSENLPPDISRPAELSATWRSYPADSPMSAQFSPYSQPPPSATWATGGSGLGSREEAAWSGIPAPGRSMSYSGESMGGQPLPPQLAMAHGRQFDRRASNFTDMYSAPMGSPIPGMGTGMTAAMDPTGSVPAATLLSHNQRAWQGQPGLQRNQSFSTQEDNFAPVVYGESGGSHGMLPGPAGRTSQRQARKY